MTGIDDAARALSKSLADVNVKCDFVSVPTHPTITKLRVLSRNQQLIRLDFEEGFEGVDPQPLHERINQALSSIGALVLSDYAKGALASVQQMIQLARKAGVPVLIDPKGTDFERYRGATLLTPNLSEFEAVVGKCKTEEEIVERGMKLIADYELSALLVTRSEQGMSLLQPGKAPLHMPTQAQEVYDVTGAGDTVIGVWRQRWQRVIRWKKPASLPMRRLVWWSANWGRPRFRRSSWKTLYVDAQIPALA